MLKKLYDTCVECGVVWKTERVGRRGGESVEKVEKVKASRWERSHNPPAPGDDII